MSKKIWLILFIVCFITKLTSIIYLHHLTVQTSPALRASAMAIYAGDSFSYIGAMENYIQTGEYYFQSQNILQKEKVFAGRLPHYASVYFVLRLMFDQAISFDLLVILQVLSESISIVLLVKLVFGFTNNKWITLIFFSLMLISLNVTNWAYYLVPESFSVSFLIFFIYFYYQYLTKKELKNLVISAVFLGLLVVLKAYFVLFFLMVGIEFLMNEKSFKIILSKTILVSLPFLLLISPWIIRNYLKSNKFIPLQENTMAGYWQSDAHTTMNSFLKSWGGNIVFWETKAPSYYFMNDNKSANEYKFPSYAIAEGYTVKDLENIRTKMLTLSANYNVKLDKEIAQDFEIITKKYQENSFFNYRIKAPFIILKDFIFHSGSYYLPISQSFSNYKPYQFVIKVIQSGLYYLTLIFGLLGLIIFTFKTKWGYVFLSIPLFLVIFFAIIMRTSEWRMFMSSYPFLAMGVILLLNFIYNYFKENKKNANT